ncbi:MAG: hypothetical protein P4M05_36155 [Bradyrhizobium sp.]|nr:hypothetical protein [Bradyrhizobium sp.]
MRFETGKQFLAEPHKRLTLMGMSNIGKTTLAASMPASNWFHYSVDYRLATAYLKEAMVDVIKTHMMTLPYLSMHLREDLMSVDLNVGFGRLGMVSHYLGKLGNPYAGGLLVDEFNRRQERHRRAEIAAVGDIPTFIARGFEIYGYDHFINDASGSLCELINLDDDDDPVLRSVIDHTVLIYLKADAEQEAALIDRAVRHPKPLYFRPEFLDLELQAYLVAQGSSSTSEIDPDEFVKWVFVRLLEARRPRYEHIARYGYTIEARNVAGANETGFLHLIAKVIDEVHV